MVAAGFGIAWALWGPSGLSGGDGGGDPGRRVGDRRLDPARRRAAATPRLAGGAGRRSARWVRGGRLDRHGGASRPARVTREGAGWQQPPGRGIEVLASRDAPGARDVPGARVDGLGLAAEALGLARVDHDVRAVGGEVLGRRQRMPARGPTPSARAWLVQRPLRRLLAAAPDRGLTSAAGSQPAVAPPSTGSVAPVTKRASSLSRNATNAATSSGPATRPVGLGAESAARSTSGPTPSSSR
jgi:hypothetical protein